MPEDDASRSWDRIRSKVNEIALENREFGGYPLPDTDQPLILEPTHPLRENFAKADRKEPDPQTMREVGEQFDWSAGTIDLVNYWWSERHQCEVYVYRLPGSDRVKVAKRPRNQPGDLFTQYVNTLGASRNWSVSAEEQALEKLRGMVKPHQYRDYVLTGVFFERSQRSNVLYLFRRCAPTIAAKHNDDGTFRVLAGLCGHPVGYYKHSGAGAMVATDDVIAHLTLMRGDEHFFWKKCNQHAAEDVR